MTAVGAADWDGAQLGVGRNGSAGGDLLSSTDGNPDVERRVVDLLAPSRSAEVYGGDDQGLLRIRSPPYFVSTPAAGRCGIRRDGRQLGRFWGMSDFYLLPVIDERIRQPAVLCPTAVTGETMPSR